MCVYTRVYVCEIEKKKQTNRQRQGRTDQFLRLLVVLQL